MVDRGVPTLRLIRRLALFALGLMIVAASPEARAIDAVSVRSDAPAIDLTAVLDYCAGVVGLATWMLLSAHRLSQRSTYALECSGPCPS